MRWRRPAWRLRGMRRHLHLHPHVLSLAAAITASTHAWQLHDQLPVWTACSASICVRMFSHYWLMPAAALNAARGCCERCCQLSPSLLPVLMTFACPHAASRIPNLRDAALHNAPTALPLCEVF